MEFDRAITHLCIFPFSGRGKHPERGERESGRREGGVLEKGRGEVKKKLISEEELTKTRDERRKKRKEGASSYLNGETSLWLCIYVCGDRQRV